MKTFEGIVPPLVTPFREDGGLDLQGFEKNFALYSECDLGGYLVLGSNGEAVVLEEEEKLALIRAARRAAQDRFLLVGTGLESTQATIELTKKAADLGADGALVLTPHYYRSQISFEVLRGYYEAVADASSIPVFLYSVPSFTGIPFPPTLASALAAHPRVRGMKESSGDLNLLGQILASVPDSFTVACGSAPVAYPAFCLGARAAILAVACCAPRAASNLYEAFQKGDHPRAKALQAALTPLAVAVTSTFGVAGLKAAMDIAGLRGGAVRSPLRRVSATAEAEIRRLIDRA